MRESDANSSSPTGETPSRRLIEALPTFRRVMRRPQVSAGLACWWVRSKVTFSTWNRWGVHRCFCFWTWVGGANPPGRYRTEPALPGHRCCYSPLLKASFFSCWRKKKTRKHLLPPAARVGAAAPPMSRQQGLDLASVLNVAPALQKAAG